MQEKSKNLSNQINPAFIFAMSLFFLLQNYLSNILCLSQMIVFQLFSSFNQDKLSCIR